MNKILDALRTPVAMLLALVLALVAQLEHTAQVFMQVVDAHGIYAQVHSYAFAVAVETAVLLFVLAGHRRISYGFAIATALTNLSYYAMQGVDLLSVHGAPAWLMSLLLPAAIVGYSHTIADAPRGGDLPEYSHAMPPEGTKEPRKKNKGYGGAVSPVQAQPVPAEQASEGVGATPAPAEQTGAMSAQPEGADVPTHDTRTQALQLRDEGYTAAEIARMTGAKYSTVQSWLRRATAQTNGGTHL